VQNEVIKPAIRGVIDIMKACLKAKSVRRLVFTSSAITTHITHQQKPIYDETCWTDVELCRRVKMTGWVSTFFSPTFNSFFFVLSFVLVLFYATTFIQLPMLIQHSC